MKAFSFSRIASRVAGFNLEIKVKNSGGYEIAFEGFQWKNASVSLLSGG